MLSPIVIAPLGHSGSHMSQLMHLSVISSAMITYQLGYVYPDQHLSYALTDRILDPYLLELG